MIGAGVFFVWAPAAAVAGNGLLVGLAIAAIVALLNALSTTQLAMAYPISGGSYSYARATVGERIGFSAGVLFLAGKTASVAAIALIAGSYLWPVQARAIAVAALVVFALVNASGIRSTATVSAVILAVVLGGLVFVIVAGLSQGHALAPLQLGLSAGPYGILQSAGLLFFCFAGYARMATLGEEVVDPRRTLPRAIFIALGIVFVIYFAVALTALTLHAPAELAVTASPLAGGAGDVMVRVVAALACLGSLVGILAALSRTGLAMARGGDLPGALAFISERTHAPVVAEAVIAVIAIAAVLLLEPARLVGFSSCAVLVYYAIAHLSALRQPSAERWLPRWVSVAGLVGCLLLALTLPWPALVATAAVLVLALGIRLVVRTVKR